MSTTVKTLRYYTAGYRQHPWLVLGLLLMGPAFALQTAISPLFIAKILGQLASHQSVTTAYIWLAGSSLFGGALFCALLDRFCMLTLTNLTMHRLYRLCLQRLLRQESGFFADNFSGSLVTDAIRFSKGYEMFNNVAYLDIYSLWCSVLVAIGIMIYYNTALGLAIAVLWVLSLLLVAYLVKRRIPVRRHAVAQESKVTGELADIITNVATVKSFAAEQHEQDRYEIANVERSRRLRISWQRAILNHYSTQAACVVMQLVVLIGGIMSVQHGSLTIATFLLFQVYILRIIDSVSKASVEMRLLEGVFGDAADMTERLDRAPTVLDPAEPEKLEIKSGAIGFQKVNFDYITDNGKTALFHNLTLAIQPGERVGLVGPSGGGKTTITKLLLRFTDIQAGSITLDNQDIRTITQHDLHSVISYVPQEPLLFHRSLLENIGYGNPKASKAQIIAAAKQAHADDFIRDLPQGYETLVGERGIKLSGGQRQRVAIARAMLKQAPILVLDEATSALDSESEKYIQEALWKLMEGKTTLVIAHRLSTIQHLDRIIVLDKGKIIEQGTHTELLKKKGMYAKLWSHQSGGFLEQ